MRVYLITSTLVSMVLAGLLAMAHAQPADEGPTPTWVADAGPVSATVVAAIPADKPAPDAGEPTVEELIRQAAELKSAIDSLRSAKGGKLALWFAALAALTYLLMTAIKLGLKLAPEQKWWLSWAALAIGCAAGFFGAYTGDWTTALIYGAGPPMAVFIRELVAKFK